eukprot:TRINITY_DN9405_c0_g8_i2.p2 TRINITY_DN9405_c0_g8~~TRINITY_DN9405_c0_g8_i2.p2  ORF type:complete len:183 (-),score=32.93 TRINITY_DN9405_c0_g8_i2:72-620(-)
MTTDHLIIDPISNGREEFLATPSINKLQGERSPRFASPLLGVIMNSKDPSDEVQAAGDLNLENGVKRIGMLTADERKLKVEKYWAKKHKRTWKKTIAYNSRKEMARKRLRIKGRFVSQKQLQSLANLNRHKEEHSRVQKRRKDATATLPVLKEKVFKVRRVRRNAISKKHKRCHVPARKANA